MSPTPWTTLRKIFAELADLNHPDLNCLINSRGKRISIPVELQNKDGKTLITAQVNMLPSPQRMDGAAVLFLDQRMRHHGIHIMWEKALTGSGTSKKEIDAGRYLAYDHLAQAIMPYQYQLPLRKNLHRISQTNKQRPQEAAPITPYREVQMLCHTIIADSATMISEDLERTLFERKPILKKLGGFKFQKLEF